MPTVDLFGNVKPEETKEQKYRKYLSSAKWKKKCEEKKKSVGCKCEKCGRDEDMRKLTVHHLNYDHFGNEPLEDLKVLCNICHKAADWKREKEVAERNYQKLEDARFEGWARKVYGDDWMMGDIPYIYEEYRDWCERQDY